MQSSLRFLAGTGYLALVACFFSANTGVGFLPMFFGVLAGAAFCTGLALVWLTRWALRDDTRPAQFGLGSLFFLTTFVAVYFAVVRFLVVSLSRAAHPSVDGGAEAFVAVGIVCLFLGLLSIPFVLGMAESLIWLAVWIVRRRSPNRGPSQRPRVGRDDG